MRGHTHALVGATALATIETWTGLVQPHPVHDIPTGPVLCLGAAILGSQAPDIDAERSAIKRELGLAGRVVAAGLGLCGVKHRGLTHTGLALLAVLACAWWGGRLLGYADVGLAFGLGYASHLLADGMTLSGVPLCWPRRGRFHLLPRPLRLRTGGPAEWLLFLLGLVVLGWLLPGLIPAQIWRMLQ